MGKPWYQSITVLSAVAFAVLQTLEQNGVIASGGTKALADVVQNILIATGVFGLRRALPPT